jgi:carbon monoxide dehydrogenase subunit G
MHIEGSIEIEASPAVLWPLLTEGEQIMRWTPEIVSEDSPPGPPRVGAISRVGIKEGSRVVEYTTEVGALEPQAYLEIELKGGGLGAGPMRVGYRLSPANGRTTLNYSSDRQAHGLMLKLMLPLIIFMSRRKSRGSLQRLKALAES